MVGPGGGPSDRPALTWQVNALASCMLTLGSARIAVKSLALPPTDGPAKAQWKGNPIDILEPIAKAKIPIIHVVGDKDDVVPIDENTMVLKERYEKLGGHVELIVKAGVGHHPHSLTDPTPIVDYILKNRLKE